MKLRTEIVDGTLQDQSDVRVSQWDNLEHDALAAHALLQAIEEEPEFPGQMPDEMWEALRNDRDALTFAFVASARATKSEIKKRADELMREWTGKMTK